MIVFLREGRTPWDPKLRRWTESTSERRRDGESDGCTMCVSIQLLEVGWSCHLGGFSLLCEVAGRNFPKMNEGEIRSGQGGLGIMENIWNGMVEWRGRLAEKPSCVRWVLVNERETVHLWFDFRHKSFLSVSHSSCVPVFFLHWETFYWTNLLRSWYVQLNKNIIYIEWKRKGKRFLSFCLDFLLGLIFDMDLGHCTFYWLLTLGFAASIYF